MFLSKKVKVYISLILSNIIFVGFCSSQEKKITIDLNKDLNQICIHDRVYNMEVIDSTLRNQIIKYIPNQYTNFVLVMKIKKFGMYRMGCVSSSNFISCTHARESYIFFVYDNKVVLFPNLLDKEGPNNELDIIERKKLINKNQKNELLSKIDLIITTNVSTKSNYRW